VTLDGIRVIEIAAGIAGPYAGLRLADLGAEVIKVETGASGDWARGAAPPMPDGTGALFAALNRGKRSLALAGDPAGWREALAALLARCDVAILDLPAAVLAASGLDTLLEQPGRRVVARLTPFGEAGPLADAQGGELQAQAMAGYTRYLGRHGEAPLRLGADVAGMGTGIFTVQAILAALLERAASGQGQVVSLSQLGSLLALKTVHLAAQSDPDNWGGPRLGGANDPPEHGWRTADRPITFAFGGSVGAEGRPGWMAFVEEMGLQRLAEDPRFDKAGRNSTGLGPDARRLKGEYEARFRELPSADIIDSVRRHAGIGAAYNTPAEALAHEQTRTLGIVQEAEAGQAALRFPARFSALQPRIASGVPRLGADGIAVLRDIAALPDTEIERMLAAGIIAGVRGEGGQATT
jgi:crotonobetainyl-CoA:carnitine CoA-transferase CaiB-like acyl-CoA transferase